MLSKTTGIESLNKFSFGCSCHAIANLIHALCGFPGDIKPYKNGAGEDVPLTPQQIAFHQAHLAKLEEDVKQWEPGPNWTHGSSVFCLLTKNQLDAKAILEKHGFEVLGFTASSHLWQLGNAHLKEFADKLDANEVIYLMGKGWFHEKPKVVDESPLCEGESK